MAKRKRQKTADYPQEWKVGIVGDAMMGNAAVGGGRLIPVVILDTTDRSDVAEAIKLHHRLGPGDTTCQWGGPPKQPGVVVLIINFLRPVATDIALTFDIASQGAIVEQIITTRAVYFQAGAPGDRLKTTLAVPRILVEIPDTGFDAKWEELLSRSLIEEFRGRGLTSREAEVARKDFISTWRDFGGLRIS